MRSLDPLGQRNCARIMLGTADYQGRSQDFSKGGGGGVTLCQTISSWRFRDGIL